MGAPWKLLPVDDCMTGFSSPKLKLADCMRRFMASLSHGLYDVGFCM